MCLRFIFYMFLGSFGFFIWIRLEIFIEELVANGNFWFRKVILLLCLELFLIMFFMVFFIFKFINFLVFWVAVLMGLFIYFVLRIFRE